jgi:hypothetical protein
MMGNGTGVNDGWGIQNCYDPKLVAKNVQVKKIHLHKVTEEVTSLL